VFVKTAKGSFERRDVVVGRSRGLVEVRSGVKEGDASPPPAASCFKSELLNRLPGRGE